MKTLGLLTSGVVLALSAINPFATTAVAKTKDARCEIFRGDTQLYAGACEFKPLGKGSFAISPRAQAVFYDEAEGIEIWIIEAGVAEARTRTTFGHSSRMGRMVRSKVDRACWIEAEGEYSRADGQTRICAY